MNDIKQNGLISPSHSHQNERTFTDEIIKLVQHSKQRTATAVNAELTLLYWHIGNRINQHILGDERAKYGEQVVQNLSLKLIEKFGKGWSKRHLNYLMQFASAFPDIQIVHTLRAKLSWSHFKLLVHLDDPLKRDFYATMAAQERWSTRTLDERIGSLLFERTAISKKPDETIVQELQLLREKGEYNQSLVLKDPYILDFLELNDRYLEKDLKNSDIHIAEYMSVLPSKEVLENRLKLAAQRARAKFPNKE